MNTSYYGTNTTYGYDYGAVQAFGTGMLIFVGILWLIVIALGILQLVSMWKIFKKAGKPGWASIIPVYNTIVLFEIVDRKWWTLFLMMIPFYNIYLFIMINIELAKKFGKSSGFGVGLALIPVIFYPILAFGKENIFENEQTIEPDESSSFTSENANVESNLDMDNSSINNQFTENNFSNIQEQNIGNNTQQDVVSNYSNEPWPPVSGFNNVDKPTNFNNEINIPNDNVQNLFQNSELSTYQNQVNMDTMNAVSEALNTIDTLNAQNVNNVLFGADEFNPDTTKENVQQEYEQSVSQEKPIIQRPLTEENNMMSNNGAYFQQPFVPEQVNDSISQDVTINDEISMSQPVITPPNSEFNIKQVRNEVLFSNEFNEQQNIQKLVNEEIIDFETDNQVIDNNNFNQDNGSNSQI